MTTRALGVLRSSQAKWLQTRQLLVVCTHLAGGPAAGTYVVVAAACGHTRSGGGQGGQRVPGPALHTLLAMEVLAVMVYYWVLPCMNDSRSQ